MTQDIIPIRSTTQQFIEIEDIQDDIALFQDGSCAMVISTTAVNFGLLSEKEQEALIYAYAGLLNSLSFPIQLLIRSQQKDISSYLHMLDDQEKQETNPKRAASIHSYKTFIAATVKERNVLDKKFFIIIPFSRLELGASPSVLFGNKTKGLPYPKKYVFERALTVLAPKKDHVLRLLARLGLRADTVPSDKLAHLFFSVYNPGTPFPENGMSAIRETQQATSP